MDDHPLMQGAPLTETAKTLLWIDDDKRSRFLSEVDTLAADGWTVEWAESGEEALHLLASCRYAALIVDQMLPLHVVDFEQDVWAGVRLLYWLQQRGQPGGAPRNEGWLHCTAATVPLAENRKAPCLIVSAFQDDQVDAALRSLDPPPAIVVKPVDEDVLLARLRRAADPRQSG